MELYGMKSAAEAIEFVRLECGTSVLKTKKTVVGNHKVHPAVSAGAIRPLGHDRHPEVKFNFIL
jgi:hypothetical protein